MDVRRVFKYSWNDSLGRPITATFWDNWNRLNYCKAATYYRSHYTDARNIKREMHYLISYSTPIAMIARTYHIGTGEIMDLTAFINRTYWDCSSTTIHQLSRWLTELNFFKGIDLDYHSVSKIMRDETQGLYHSVPNRVKGYDGVTFVCRTPHAEMLQMFTACPRWTVS